MMRLGLFRGSRRLGRVVGRSGPFQGPASLRLGQGLKAHPVTTPGLYRLSPPSAWLLTCSPYQPPFHLLPAPRSPLPLTWSQANLTLNSHSAAASPQDYRQVP